MKTNLLESSSLSIAGLLLVTGSLFSQTNIEEHFTSGPLQLMFQDEHDQEKLTPCQALNRKAISAMGEQEPPGPGPAGEAEPAPSQPFTREGRKVGRNEPCPCGSGKKYKQCHGRL